ncbi:MAG: hypothetical protein ACI93R_001712, partial [Flavobacteriales bacterium]
MKSRTHEIHDKNPKNPFMMKYSNIDINSKTHAIPDVRFEEEKITSFGGLVVFQLLLKSLNLKHRLRLCLERGQPKKTYG